MLALIAWALALSPSAVALPDLPAAPPATALEQRSLAGGEIAFRYPGPYTILAMVDVDAPPDVVIEAVVDLPPRLVENTGMLSLDTYAERPGYTAAKWELGVAFYTVWLHLEYKWNADEGWCRYGLDKAKPSDIYKSEGWYRAVPRGDGSRLYYSGTARGQFNAPAWLRKRLSTNGTTELLVGIRRRAEASAR